MTTNLGKILFVMGQFSAGKSNIVDEVSAVANDILELISSEEKIFQERTQLTNQQMLDRHFGRSDVDTGLWEDILAEDPLQLMHKRNEGSGFEATDQRLVKKLMLKLCENIKLALKTPGFHCIEIGIGFNVKGKNGISFHPDVLAEVMRETGLLDELTSENVLGIIIPEVTKKDRICYNLITESRGDYRKSVQRNEAVMAMTEELGFQGSMLESMLLEKNIPVKFVENGYIPWTSVYLDTDNHTGQTVEVKLPAVTEYKEQRRALRKTIASLVKPVLPHSGIIQKLDEHVIRVPLSSYQRDEDGNLRRKEFILGNPQAFEYIREHAELYTFFIDLESPEYNPLARHEGQLINSNPGEKYPGTVVLNLGQIASGKSYLTDALFNVLSDINELGIDDFGSKLQLSELQRVFTDFGFQVTDINYWQATMMGEHERAKQQDGTRLFHEHYPDQGNHTHSQGEKITKFKIKSQEWVYDMFRNMCLLIRLYMKKPGIHPIEVGAGINVNGVWDGLSLHPDLFAKAMRETGLAEIITPENLIVIIPEVDEYSREIYNRKTEPGGDYRSSVLRDEELMQLTQELGFTSSALDNLFAEKNIHIKHIANFHFPESHFSMTEDRKIVGFSQEQIEQYAQMRKQIAELLFPIIPSSKYIPLLDAKYLKIPLSSIHTTSEGTRIQKHQPFGESDWPEKVKKHAISVSTRDLFDQEQLKLAVQEITIRADTEGLYDSETSILFRQDLTRYPFTIGTEKLFGPYEVEHEYILKRRKNRKRGKKELIVTKTEIDLGLRPRPEKRL